MSSDDYDRDDEVAKAQAHATTALQLLAHNLRQHNGELLQYNQQLMNENLRPRDKIDSLLAELVELRQRGLTESADTPDAPANQVLGTPRDLPADEYQPG
jgi:hypothetical protein